MPTREDIATSYDAVAGEYVRRIFGELQHKPLDQELLNRFAESVRKAGSVCDVGCGPGHVARYLHDRGVDICGIDLSHAMVEQAKRSSPAIPFDQGDMTKLAVAEATWDGIVAFYSLIHIPLAEMPTVFSEFRRVLRPGGLLLVAFHIGTDVLHLEEWWGHAVNIDFFFFRTEDIAAQLTAAGFDIESIVEREPYPDVEHQSRRSYVFARRK